MSLPVGVGWRLVVVARKAVDVASHVPEKAGPLALKASPCVHVRADDRLPAQLVVDVRCWLK